MTFHGSEHVLRAGESLTALLLRSGAGALDAALADRLADESDVSLPPGTRLRIGFGETLPGGAREIDRAEIRPLLGLTLLLERKGGELTLQRRETPVDATPWRLRGAAGADLSRTLRDAGLPAALADEAAGALSARTPHVSGSDRFDLILASRTTGSGERELGPLLYAGLHRAGGAVPLQLMRWPADAGGRLVDPVAAPEAVDGGLLTPVAGRRSSGFGWRFHPILGFPRFHRGVDFAAPRGTPVRAAAAGLVIKAGWAGGYGWQIQVAHDVGLVTSYSHLSRIAVREGQRLYPGATLGAVGSTGLSTGPHLHFETHRNGRAIAPELARTDAGPTLAPAELARLRDRLHQLLSSEYRERID